MEQLGFKPPVLWDADITGGGLTRCRCAGSSYTFLKCLFVSNIFSCVRKRHCDAFEDTDVLFGIRSSKWQQKRQTPTSVCVCQVVSFCMLVLQLQGLLEVWTWGCPPGLVLFCTVLLM